MCRPLGFVLLCTLLTGSSGVPTGIVRTAGVDTEADSNIKYMYIKTIETLLNLTDEKVDPSWNLIDNMDKFKDDDIVENFVNSINEGTLPRVEIFDMRDPKIREETIKIFDLFYFAENFDAMIEVAYWLRPKINYEQFVYALSMAVTWRFDVDVELPPWYEVFPNYFIPAEALAELKRAKAEGKHNHTVEFGWEESEDGLGYLREDVEWNSLYYTWFLYYPNWLDLQKYEQLKVPTAGELFYYMHRQLVARYRLELLGRADLTYIAWNDTLQAFDPKLMDLTGKPFAGREDGIVLSDVQPLGQEVITIDDRIKDIPSNAEMASKKFEPIEMDGGGVVELIARIYYNYTPAGVPHYLGALFDSGSQLLASAVSKNQTGMSERGVVGSPMTALRDPEYYRFLYRMVTTIERYILQYQEPYQEVWKISPFVEFAASLDVRYDQATLEIVEVSELATYFDYLELDVTNAVVQEAVGRRSAGRFTARQKRLNHRPFTLTFRLNNSHPTSQIVRVVRVYLGPPWEILKRNFNGTRTMLLEIDRFVVKLEKDENIIKRDSMNMTAFANEPETFFKKYSRIKKNFFKENDTETYHQSVRYCGLPGRMVLPKGGPGEGKEYTLLAAVTPVTPDFEEGKALLDRRDKVFDAFVQCGGKKYYDGAPMGYPFDRPFNGTEYPKSPDVDYMTVRIKHTD